jgi:diguanylate cyclase (GGDEF)-like protein
MQADAHLSARLRAYHLMEAAQGDDHEHVLGDLLALEADALARGWADAALLAACGRFIDALLREPDRSSIAPFADELVRRARDQQDRALLGVALALRAVGSAEAGDHAGVLADAGRAVALVDPDDLDPMDRCFAWVVCAAAYNVLNLWELTDELYDRASAIASLCVEAVQEPAIAMNRVIVRLEWSAALLELGEESEALVQLRRAAEAVETAAGADNVPPQWAGENAVARDLLDFVGGALESGATASRADTLDRHRDALARVRSVEFGPLLTGLTAVALLRAGRPDRAAAWAADPDTLSSTSGSHSFLAWVRAEVAAWGHDDPALVAAREYGSLVCRLRWNARTGVLAAARSKIDDERLSVEHAVLSRDVLLDPLTGVANRRRFDDWLVAVPSDDLATALIVLDIDYFKLVNDVHGHAVGDEVLRRVAQVLTDHVRVDDLALRLGGDEFALLIAGGDDVAAIKDTALRRAEAVRDAIAGADWDQLAPGLVVRVSVGVAALVVGPLRSDAADRLYRAADADLYDAKAARLFR